jgi:hypothetical protein
VKGSRRVLAKLLLSASPGDVLLNFQMCIVEVTHLHARACMRSLISLPSVQSQRRKEFVMISVHAADTFIFAVGVEILYKRMLRRTNVKAKEEKSKIAIV